MLSRSITPLDGKPLRADFCRQGACRGRLREATREGGLNRPAQCGFVLASAIFLLLIMAALAAFIVQVSVASQTTSAQDVQGARAYQAARLGIEAGLYEMQVVKPASCPAASTTLPNIPGLTGFKVTWTCTSYAFTESAVIRTIWQITATACTTSGAACPSASTAELQSADYTERQLVVLTER